MGKLDNKVALVSGGARGMGAAHAWEIVAQGGAVVIGDVLDEEGIALAEEIGTQARYIHLDVTSESDWAAAVALAVGAFGRLNVLVNNAGICTMGSIESFTLDDWNRIISINLTGQFLGIRAATPALTEAAPASIINISSTAGMEGISGLHGYAASKFAIRGLTRCIAIELADRKIRANTICPGTIATPMNEGLDVSGFNPMNRKADPKEVSKLVVFLASDDSSFISGSDIIIDGGELAGHGPLSSR
ncbi:SDR family oxidoreductase [Sphingomonas lycopersici]|uniref:SDR family oxidoreductase n=1 Tax=Sphingomonas lycopersici TaxID=2951807 RepID=A0AA42CQV6_9SPHN|nr:SDR family oxidoreductase [Sphingomonas lycopersici]MCW6536075.1 SDR family oxidoreductase [Sphingomonas lycopersici]